MRTLETIRKSKKIGAPARSGRGLVRLLPFFIALAVLVSVFSPFGSSRANAQFFNELAPNNAGIDYSGTGIPTTQEPSNYVETAPTSAGGMAAKAENNGAPNKGPESFGCVGILPYTVVVPTLHLDACVANIVYIIMWIFSWILWLAGKILDMSVYYTLNLADLMTHVPVVDIGWKIFRDLANIFFIFILLWTAIGTILGLIGGKTKEIIVNLIVVALLMNFSLFITKTVIDASNIVALHFYNLIVSPNNNTPNVNWTQSAISAASWSNNSSFSGAFMEGLKIQTIYQPQTAGGIDLVNGNLASGMASDVVGGALNMGKVILIGIFGIILMLTAAYVFFVAAILFIVRVVVLMMVMILSPLGFLAFALPATEGYAEQWKEKLISQSLFAPIYMALTYVVVKTIQSDAFRTGVMSVNRQDTASSAASAASLIFGLDNGSTAGFAFVFNFILLIGLMLGSIMVAKKMEAVGVETAVELGKHARGFVGRNIARAKYFSVVSGTASMITKGAERLGVKDFEKKGFGKLVAGTEKKFSGLQKKYDMGELDKKFERSKFGTSSFGSFIREHTTAGSIIGTKAKFGGEKSVHEAYEEDEKLRAQRVQINNQELSNKLKEERARAGQDVKEIEKEIKVPDVRDFVNALGKFDSKKYYEAEANFLKAMEEVRKKGLASAGNTTDIPPVTGTVPTPSNVPPAPPAPPAPANTPPENPPTNQGGQNPSARNPGRSRFGNLEFRNPPNSPPNQPPPTTN